MQRIEAILRKEIGLNAASIGLSVFERVLRLRMKLHNLNNTEEYQTLLANSSGELDAFIEAIVVTETWFMRGREAFAAFAELALNDWLSRNSVGLMRVLSLPCSSGEEPFSIAMALLDAGFPVERFAIDAVDISANALARASNAIYGNNSFRGKHLEFRDRYFVKVDDGYALSPDVQRCVAFRRDNLLRGGFSLGVRYDFIFCRNLLIYLDRAMQGLALEKIRSMLLPDGVLFVGPAEMPIVTECGFVSARISHAGASRLKPSSPESGNRRSNRRLALPKPQNPVHEIESQGELDKAVSLLVIARQFADAGLIAEASELCERHIKENETCAEGYYLMGLLREAGKDAGAIIYYRKAIYLQPNHHEALVHAALWLEKNGDVIRADAFKRRAERVRPKPLDEK